MELTKYRRHANFLSSGACILHVSCVYTLLTGHFMNAVWSNFMCPKLACDSSPVIQLINEGNTLRSRKVCFYSDK